MGNFFEETMQGLLEAAEIAKGNIPLTEREDISSAPTFCTANNGTKKTVWFVKIPYQYLLIGNFFPPLENYPLYFRIFSIMTQSCF